mmetsp:Transcript_17285/g.43906  ORF Transcript_17285/g.43906 Transcript_17285/m.43906 type:complete len:224 (+) Transcript_17285:452-1123(+)
MRFMSPPFCICSRKEDVPDLAMVPRLLIRSCLVMPMPRSRSISTFRSVSKLILISSLASSPSPSCSGSVRLRKRSLSSASLAFEMSSRRKMSLLEYRLLMIMSIRRFTSAWNSNFWAPSRGVLSLAAGAAAPSPSSPSPAWPGRGTAAKASRAQSAKLSSTRRLRGIAIAADFSLRSRLISDPILSWRHCVWPVETNSEQPIAVPTTSLYEMRGVGRCTQLYE